MPSTPFIGVRISWLILATNSDLMRLALTAASRLNSVASSCASMRASMPFIVCASSPISSSRALSGRRSDRRVRSPIVRSRCVIACSGDSRRRSMNHSASRLASAPAASVDNSKERAPATAAACTVRGVSSCTSSRCA